MKTTRDFILEEAVDSVQRLLRDGHSLRESLDVVERRLKLEEEDVEEVSLRVSSPSETEVSNVIWFSSEDEAMDAIEALMFRKIAWQSKGKVGDLHYILFDSSETLAKAHEVLKYRWKLIDADSKTTAMIQFDNIEDYQKVMKFINDQGMVFEIGKTGKEFSELSNDEKLKDRDGRYIAVKDVPNLKDFKPKDNPSDRTSFIFKTWQ